MENFVSAALLVVFGYFIGLSIGRTVKARKRTIEVFDEEEIIEGCTVRIFSNSKTGNTFYQWWKGSKDDLKTINIEEKRRMNMRIKVNLDTLSKANRFVDVVSQIEGEVFLTDRYRNFIVNGKSLIGALYTMEFQEIWCESDTDIYGKIHEFVAE